MEVVPTSPKPRFPCLCCGAVSLDEPGDASLCEICGQCGWDHWYECHESPDAIIQPNYVSLRTLQDVVRRFGAAAACQINMAGGLTVEDLEAMTAAQLASLKTHEQEWRGDH